MIDIRELSLKKKTFPLIKKREQGDQKRKDSEKKRQDCLQTVGENFLSKFPHRGGPQTVFEESSDIVFRQKKGIPTGSDLLPMHKGRNGTWREGTREK